MYGAIDDFGAVADPTDVFGAGAVAASGVAAQPRAQVGGPQFPSAAGYDSTGFTRIATGTSLDSPPPAPSQTTWKSLFDYRSNPTFWLLLILLAAVGLIHARVSVAGRAGPARAGLAGGF